VKLSETSTATMDRDLFLFVKCENPYKGSLVFEVRLIQNSTTVHFNSLCLLYMLLQESSKGSSAMMLSILPKFKQVEHKAELIFVIDRSSSMNGAGIQQAKRTLLVNVV